MPDLYLDQGWNAHAGFTHDLARLHHYAVRSVESFLVKRDRGRTNHYGDDQGLAYWSNMNCNSTRDTSLHARLPALRRELDGLLQDPELARLHARPVTGTGAAYRTFWRGTAGPRSATRSRASTRCRTP